MRILGIESSCDETAAAVVDGNRQILSNIVWSQVKEHAAYGGVVPEIAARSHLEQLDGIIATAMREAKTSYEELDAIAVAGGPGLIGGLLVGVMTAKAIAWAHQKPFIAVNHLEAHALTARLTNEVSFPFLLLLVSGGHCQILEVAGVGKYRVLGGTMDDALGEAYDKTAKMLGLGYPGGPKVEKLAREGNGLRFTLPRPLKGRAGCDFSFSGLKTAVRQLIIDVGELSEKDKADICAAFQMAVADIVIERLEHALVSLSPSPLRGEGRVGVIENNDTPIRPSATFPPLGGRKISQMVMAGGVAANQFLRGRVEGLLAAHNMELVAPPIALCTDNAAMIAWAGIEKFRLGMADSLEFEARARWSLEN